MLHGQSGVTDVSSVRIVLHKSHNFPADTLERLDHKRPADSVAPAGYVHLQWGDMKRLVQNP